jgi:multiple sugar transport system permease protein
MAKVVQIEATAPARPRHETWLRFMKFTRARVFPRVLLIVLGFFYLMPFYWMLVNAFKSNEELRQQPPTWYPHHLEWSNFQRAIDVMNFWLLFKNTAFITVFTVLGVGLTVPMVAYGFSRIDWPGRDKVFFLVLATVFIPFPAFWIFLLRQFFMQIPIELSDAAKIDGANELRILFQIIMPQSWPALVSVSMFAALHAWNDFLGPLLYLHLPEKYTLSVGLTFFSSQSSHDIQFNLLMAASVLTVLPVVILFFSFQRAFVEGVTVGAFK